MFRQHLRPIVNYTFSRINVVNQRNTATISVLLSKTQYPL